MFFFFITCYFLNYMEAINIHISLFEYFSRCFKPYFYTTHMVAFEHSQAHLWGRYKGTAYVFACTVDCIELNTCHGF